MSVAVVRRTNDVEAGKMCASCTVSAAMGLMRRLGALEG
jgi:hypothetical protein